MFHYADTKARFCVDWSSGGKLNIHFFILNRSIIPKYSKII
ncbi:hypothetical protein HMPREF9136_2667 [Prevotella dentalis DSM 3688]|uniref:Uncharacterized protein n=1 Tax=Prevotella dentalis (strain ATCC 49559 / DSM 3688 / JCM 13448 / NCTC 12043 / ES 2772) TaxID=908937 RepID=F9D739_PREDD|nr:hypothetical protein HMPREF9136_2667 [Prevotella dentalis DSM 3688]